jgi:uncharacterized protein
MFTIWKLGDTGKMESLVFSEFLNDSSLASIKDKLYTQRNIKMVEKIRKWLETNQTYFIVVGAGHTIGSSSIPELLKAGGKYKIRRL